MAKDKKTMSNKKKTNYENFTLDPEKNVLVPFALYVAMNNIFQEVEKAHSKRMRSDVYAFFSKATHDKLKEKTKLKMSAEVLGAEYYENIDITASIANVRVDRDELGSAAVQMLGELRGVFQLNVDSGNSVLRAEVEGETAQEPAPDTFESDSYGEDQMPQQGN
jgi:hypothetical protein